MTFFSVLTVCTGNICRSPLAEQLLRAGLSDLASVSVSSAGTGALVGNPMDAQSLDLSMEFGGAGGDSHVARAMTADILVQSDLVLALAREHRALIVEMSPRVLRRTFTLREFARILESFSDLDWREVAAAGDTTARLRAVVDLAGALRGTAIPPESPDDDDVVDPYRQRPEVYRASADQLVPAARSIVAAFRHVAGLP